QQPRTVSVRSDLLKLPDEFASGGVKGAHVILPALFFFGALDIAGTLAGFGSRLEIIAAPEVNGAALGRKDIEKMRLGIVGRRRPVSRAQSRRAYLVSLQRRLLSGHENRAAFRCQSFRP